MSSTASGREKILSRRVDAQLAARRDAIKAHLDHLRQVQASLNIAVQCAEIELRQVDRDIQEHEDSWARAEP